MNASRSLCLMIVMTAFAIVVFQGAGSSTAQEKTPGKPPPPKAAEPKGPQTPVKDAKEKAKEQFLGLQTPSPWKKLLASKLGPLKFDNRPIAEAVKEVAQRLNQPLNVAPGLEGTISYSKDGALNDFVKEGLEPRYCALSLEENGLSLKPVVMMKGDTVPVERGAYYSDHPEALQEIAAKCGARKDYAETVGCDGSGYLTIRGRVWFIERVRKELKLKD